MVEELSVRIRRSYITVRGWWDVQTSKDMLASFLATTKEDMRARTIGECWPSSCCSIYAVSAYFCLRVTQKGANVNAVDGAVVQARPHSWQLWSQRDSFEDGRPRLLVSTQRPASKFIKRLEKKSDVWTGLCLGARAILAHHTHTHKYRCSAFFIF